MLFGLLPAAAQEAPPSGAQTLTPEAVAQLLQQLRAQDARLQELEAQVAQLKSAQASKSASDSSAPPANSAVPSTEAGAASTPSEAHPPEAAATPAVETPQDAAPEPVINHVLGPVQFNGFSDIDYGRAWFEDLPRAGLKDFPSSFAIGDFDLFTNTRLSERWSMLCEMLATTDFSNETSVELDRLLLTYKKNDYFKISFGKFDTSLGYYTVDVHRAQYFQTPIGRPIMYSDEDSDGILPVHSIGVTAGGLIPSGKLGLHWSADLANGRSSTNPDVPIQNFVDENNGKAVTVAVYARPDWLSGFRPASLSTMMFFTPSAFRKWAKRSSRFTPSTPARNWNGSTKVRCCVTPSMAATSSTIRRPTRNSPGNSARLVPTSDTTIRTSPPVIPSTDFSAGEMEPPSE